MKTILVYAERFGANYDGFYRSLLREGRMRGWRFAWLAYRDAPDEPVRIARMFELLKPVGFVEGTDGTIAAHFLSGRQAGFRVPCHCMPKLTPCRRTGRRRRVTSRFTIPLSKKGNGRHYDLRKGRHVVKIWKDAGKPVADGLVLTDNPLSFEPR